MCLAAPHCSPAAAAAPPCRTWDFAWLVDDDALLDALDLFPDNELPHPPAPAAHLAETPPPLSPCTPCSWPAAAAADAPAATELEWQLLVGGDGSPDTHTELLAQHAALAAPSPPCCPPHRAAACASLPLPPAVPPHSLGLCQESDGGLPDALGGWHSAPASPSPLRSGGVPSWRWSDEAVRLNSQLVAFLGVGGAAPQPPTACCSARSGDWSGSPRACGVGAQHSRTAPPTPTAAGCGGAAAAPHPALWRCASEDQVVGPPTITTGDCWVPGKRAARRMFNSASPSPSHA